MAAMARPRARVAVKACHASGKTHTAADIALWWTCTGGITVTTAPTWVQVEKLLWGHIRAAHTEALFPLGGTLLQTELRLSPACYALGLSTNEGVNFQGFHGRVLIILDEAPGVLPDIWSAIEGIRAGGDVRVLALGNPTVPSGPFYDAFTSQRDGWQTFSIDAFDTPNLQGVTLAQLRAMDPVQLAVAPRPYLVTRAWLHEKLSEWGEDHPEWQSRGRALFPEQSPHALISLALLEQARWRAPTGRGDLWAGLDVAGPGESETALYIRRGDDIVDMRTWPHEDPRGEVLAALHPYKDQNIQVNVDAIGQGWYMHLHLKDAGYTVHPINVGEPARDSEKYSNAKAEHYWGLRQRFQQGAVAGLTDEKTISQLTGIRYQHTPRGQVQIESKEQARKRGVKSPDRAEALMLAFATPPMPDVPGVLLSGSSRGWF